MSNPKGWAYEQTGSQAHKSVFQRLEVMIMKSKNIVLAIITLALGSSGIYAEDMSLQNMAQPAVNMQDCMNIMNEDSEKHKEITHQMMMKKLGQKDATYDDRFIALMIAHHETGVMMAKDALNKITNPALKNMSQNIITVQEKEIAQMKAWQK